MFYSRHDAKLLLDRKQGSRRLTFGGFAGNSPLRGGGGFKIAVVLLLQSYEKQKISTVLLLSIH
jgi:hypothetical protein